MACEGSRGGLEADAVPCREFFHDAANDPRSSLPIAVGIRAGGHGLIGGRVAQERQGLRNNTVRSRTDELDGASVDAFGALRRIAHHEDRLAERWGFLLHSARVGQDQPARRGERDKMGIRLRRNEADILSRTEPAMDNVLDARVEVYRVDDQQRGALAGKLLEGVANLFETVAEILPTMAGDEDHFPLLPASAEDLIEISVQLVAHLRNFL